MVRYHREFSYKGKNRHSGFSFLCTQDGIPIKDAWGPEAQINWDKCNSGEYDVIDHGVEKEEWDYTHPATIDCNRCGTEITLHSSWANSCDKCGVEYNGSGQQLAPRSQWFEDTNECEADVLNNYDPEAIYQDADLESLSW